jgi:hypothetical protein
MSGYPQSEAVLDRLLLGPATIPPTIIEGDILLA